ncbi:N/A [soil metagenome]
MKAAAAVARFVGLLALAWERPALARTALRRLIRTGDLVGLWRRAVHVRSSLQPRRLPTPYFHLDAGGRAALLARARTVESQGPLISVVVPLYDTAPAFLRACVASVMDQAYERFELILVDDGSPSPHTRRQARLIAGSDRRIRLIERPMRGGISAATNAGVGAATGDWIAFLDHDDELTADALVAVAERLRDEPAPDVVYTDQLKVDGRGEVIDHHFKPDWSPLHLLGVMYVGHLLVARTACVRAVGGCDPTLDGVQDFDLVLRLSEAGGRIGHIAQPLYKWRAHAGSLAADARAKPHIPALQRRAVAAHLARRGRAWVATPHPLHGGSHRLTVHPTARRAPPSVSIVIPSRDQGAVVSRCLGSIRALTRHPAYEIVVVDDGTTDETALSAFHRFGARVIPGGERPFNFSRACNLGARHARGRHVLFLNNDTEVRSCDWLQRLSFWFDDPVVGAVGPVLTYADGQVQHAGVVLCARGTADHVMSGFPSDVDGYAGSLCTAREVSAVTGACLMMRRDRFAQLGGFCTDYAVHYQDVDLCLRLRRLGLSIVCTPSPTLIHHEGLTRGRGYDFGDRALFVDRWRAELARPDPFYSPWLDRERLDYGLAR